MNNTLLSLQPIYEIINIGNEIKRWILGASEPIIDFPDLPSSGMLKAKIVERQGEINITWAILSTQYSKEYPKPS